MILYMTESTFHNKLDDFNLENHHLDVDDLDVVKHLDGFRSNIGTYEYL